MLSHAAEIGFSILASRCGRMGHSIWRSVSGLVPSHYSSAFCFPVSVLSPTSYEAGIPPFCAIDRALLCGVGVSEIKTQLSVRASLWQGKAPPWNMKPVFFASQLMMETSRASLGSNLDFCLGKQVSAHHAPWLNQCISELIDRLG